MVGLVKTELENKSAEVRIDDMQYVHTYHMTTVSIHAAGQGGWHP